MSAWGAGAPGILSLPSGRLVRGRGLRRPLPDDTLPEFGVYLLNKRPEPETSGWRSPAAGGRGRTGTALACLAVLDGVPPREAVAYVREHYEPRAAETPSRRRYVTRFATS